MPMKKLKLRWKARRLQKRKTNPVCFLMALMKPNPLTRARIETFFKKKKAELADKKEEEERGNVHANA
jgi:hypothetical protein